jgi:type II secretory pathway component PulC
MRRAFFYRVGFVSAALILSVILPVVLQGCLGPTQKSPKFIDDVRPIQPALKVISYTIQRRDLQDALTKIRENPIRLVPVFQSVSSTESYEYRVFDIAVEGVYGLLGLENADIIVAANRYLIRNPAQFPAFVQLLAAENEATIEIRRGGEARLHKYTFIPAIVRRP